MKDVKEIKESLEMITEQFKNLNEKDDSGDLSVENQLQKEVELMEAFLKAFGTITVSFKKKPKKGLFKELIKIIKAIIRVNGPLISLK